MKQKKAKKAREWFKWTVEIEVHDTWVMDGFDLTDERAHDMLSRELGYAYGHELRARVIKAPPADDIRWAQGYPVEGRAPRED